MAGLSGPRAEPALSTGYATSRARKSRISTRQDVAVHCSDDVEARQLPARSGRDNARQALGRCRRIDVPAGSVLYRDREASRMGIVVAGLIRVYLTSAEGRQVTVRYAR